MGYVGGAPRGQVVSLAGSRLRSSLRGARGWWPRGHGAVRVRAAGSIRPGGRPPVAGASKTSDHALPASVRAHAAFWPVAGAKSRTWPSRIA